jgi:hypothetical protein
MKLSLSFSELPQIKLYSSRGRRKEQDDRKNAIDVYSEGAGFEFKSRHQ